MKLSNNLSKWLYGIGIFIIVGSHIYILVAGITDDKIVPHAITNFVAAGLLAFGWFGRTK